MAPQKVEPSERHLGNSSGVSAVAQQSCYILLRYVTDSNVTRLVAELSSRRALEDYMTIGTANLERRTQGCLREQVSELDRNLYLPRLSQPKAIAGASEKASPFFLSYKL